MVAQDHDAVLPVGHLPQREDHLALVVDVDVEARLGCRDSDLDALSIVSWVSCQDQPERALHGRTVVGIRDVEWSMVDPELLRFGLVAGAAEDPGHDIGCHGVLLFVVETKTRIEAVIGTRWSLFHSVSLAHELVNVFLRIYSRLQRHFSRGEEIEAVFFFENRVFRRYVCIVLTATRSRCQWNSFGRLSGHSGGPRVCLQEMASMKGKNCILSCKIVVNWPGSSIICLDSCLHLSFYSLLPGSGCQGRLHGG